MMIWRWKKPPKMIVVKKWTLAHPVAMSNVCKIFGLYAFIIGIIYILYSDQYSENCMVSWVV